MLLLWMFACFVERQKLILFLRRVLLLKTNMQAFIWIGIKGVQLRASIESFNEPKMNNDENAGGQNSPSESRVLGQ